MLNLDISSASDLRYVSIKILLLKKLDPRDYNLEDFEETEYDEFEAEGDDNVPNGLK